MINGLVVKSYKNIDWTNDFDTVILSCTEDLSAITKHSYAEEITRNAITYNEKIYAFEKIETNYKQVYYPEISSRMTPQNNLGKLHNITLPVLGVMGTSSKQGKYTLQLELIKRLREKGYNVGHIATEPSGYLFDSDFVYHFGYHSYLDIKPMETIAILNEMVWQSQIANKDILIAGCQSNTIHYTSNNVRQFPVDQYMFLIGIMADVYLLCVNPHDRGDYIKKLIAFYICENTGTCNGK